jgi:hypothetical protein
MHDLTVHHLTYYCGWTLIFFIFSIWSSNFFSSDLVLIEDQLIFFYERVGLKKGDINEKGVKHGWCVISFEKDVLWSSNFKNNTNYTILVPQYFSNSILVQKFYFLVSNWEKIERGRKFFMVKREICRCHRFRTPKWTIFILNCYFWWGELILSVFFFFYF